MTCHTRQHQGKNHLSPRFHDWRISFIAFLFITFLIEQTNGRIRVRPRNDHSSSTEENENGRITGGTAILENRYPYLVPLLISRRGVFRTRLFRRCAGTLIAPDVILSAAHCVDPVNTFFVQFHDLNVITLYVRDSFLVTTTQTTEYVVHPNFERRGLSNDLALFKLSKKQTNVRPVQLSNDLSTMQNGIPMRTIGWGNRSPNGSDPSLIVRAVDLNYISNDVCASDTYAYSESSIDDSMMCASAENKGACRGDSGGPLIRPGASSSGDVQYGVVSWGKICGDDMYPTVFARVDYDWIMSTICDPLHGLSPESCVDGEVSLS